MVSDLVLAAEPTVPILAPPPAEEFFGSYAIQRVRPSPSGRFLALETSEGGAPIHLKIIDLEGKEPPRIVAKFNDYDVADSRWLSDSWLAFSTRDLRYVSQMDGRGQWLVDRTGTEMKDTYSQSFAAAKIRERVNAEINFVPDKDSAPKPPEKLESGVYDARGTLRAGTASKEGKSRIYWLDVKTKEWRKLAEFGWLDQEFAPAFVNEKDELFIIAINSATSFSELRKFDFGTGKPGQSAILAIPGFDVNAQPIKDELSDVVYGLRVNTDSDAVVWYSAQMRAIQAKVDALLPGRVNTLTANSYASPSTVLIKTYSDRSPPQFLIYRVATEQFERIASSRPGIMPEQMGTMELFRIKARDGLDLPVWITKTDSEKPRPAVILVHGGPWVRGALWGWDEDSQFLATRGYVVIQPEFRGSLGYGDAHHRAGWKQWGQRMQDDLRDALQFATDKGWVDPNRVCVMGGSYGGYATLMELALRSPLYRCGIAWSAVTDPRLKYEVFWSDTTDELREHVFPFMVGDLEKDADMLKAIAPLEMANRITAPLMLIYGNYDRRVPIVHGKRLRAKMQDAGLEPEWIVYDGEGHGWARKKNQIDFWKRIEQFLAKHLK